MSSEDATVTNAMASKFYAVLFGPEENPRETFLSIVDGGYVFAPDDFAFLETNDLVNHKDKARNFAALVNGIPEAVGRWNRTSTSIGFMYKEEWLGNIDVPNIPLTDTQKAILDDSINFTSEHSDRYRTFKVSYLKIQNKISSLERKYNRSPQEEELLGDLKVEPCRSVRSSCFPRGSFGRTSTPVSASSGLPRRVP